MDNLISLDWAGPFASPDNSLHLPNLSEKVILLTGAADGIGRALTLALAEAGATVLMLDKKARHLEKLFDQIVERGFTEPVILPVDLMDITPESATTLAQAIHDDVGRLDGVIHNAAELGSASPLDQYDLEYWNTTLHTNLQAPYLLTRALLPLLKQAEIAHVLFTTADVGIEPSAYWGAYSIAYAGLNAQMQIWAQELENISSIRVCSVDPGPTRTQLRRRSHPGEDQAKLATPQALAPAYLSLLDPSAESTHGKIVRLQ